MADSFKKRPRASMAAGAKKAKGKANGRALASVHDVLEAVFGEVDRRLGMARSASGQKAAPRGGG